MPNPAIWILIMLAVLFTIARCDMNDAVQRSRNTQIQTPDDPPTFTPSRPGNSLPELAS